MQVYSRLAWAQRENDLAFLARTSGICGALSSCADFDSPRTNKQARTWGTVDPQHIPSKLRGSLRLSVIANDRVVVVTTILCIAPTGAVTTTTRIATYAMTAAVRLKVGGA